MKIASIEKSADQSSWIVSITEDGKVIKSTIVPGTHEQATSIAESMLTEAKAEPRLLID
jgi:hypothetical protein